MKIESSQSAPSPRAGSTGGRGFDALMAQMEHELWRGAPGGVIGASALPSPAPAVAEPPIKLPPMALPGLNARRGPAAPPVAPATGITPAPRLDRAPMAPAQGPAPRAAPTVGPICAPWPPAQPWQPHPNVADAAPPAAERSPGVAASAPQRWFAPGPGRVRLHWHAAGGVTVRLQLPSVSGGEAPDAAIVQAVLTHLRSRGVRIHEVAVNGLRYPPVIALEPPHAD